MGKKYCFLRIFDYFRDILCFGKSYYVYSETRLAIGDVNVDNFIDSIDLHFLKDIFFELSEIFLPMTILGL